MRKTLTSEVGDLKFRYRRVRGGSATPSCPMSTRLTCRGAFVTLGMKSFLAEAGADTSNQKAAGLFARNGSRVSNGQIAPSSARG